MLRKTKKVISIACVLIFILPIMSYSMDKEEFLKFLIESSYPESSTKDDNSKEEKDKPYHDDLYCASCRSFGRCDHQLSDSIELRGG